MFSYRIENEMLKYIYHHHYYKKKIKKKHQLSHKF